MTDEGVSPPYLHLDHIPQLWRAYRNRHVIPVITHRACLVLPDARAERDGTLVEGASVAYSTSTVYGGLVKCSC